MKKEYKNFAQIWAKYPNVYGLCVVWKRLNVDLAVGIDDAEPDTFDVYICMNEQGFLEKNLEDARHWKHIISTDSLEIAWFISLEQYAPLQGLKFVFGEDDRILQYYATQQASFYALTHLKHLDIEFRDKIAQYIDIIFIPNLPTLRTLRLSGRSSYIFEGILSLDSCMIERGRDIAIEATLQQLNPETLQRLTVIDTYGTLSSPLVFPSFPRLHFLDISGNKFSQLPPIFEVCKQLQTLILENTDIVNLPARMLEMTALNTLKLDKTPLKNGKIIENEADIIALIQQDTTLDIKQKLWAILLEDKEVTQNFSLIELFQLINATKQEVIIQKIILLCEENTPQNPLDNVPTFTQITLLGVLPAMLSREAKRILEAHKIVISSSISGNTEVVCIGETPNLSEITKLLAMPQKPIICLPTHLKAYIYTLEKPYLIQADEATIDNLRHLLTSDNKANILLALQIIKTGGLPPTFLEHLCLMWLKDDNVNQKNKDYVETIRKVIQTNCSSVQYLAIYRIIKSPDDKDKCLDNLLECKHLNPFYLLDVMLQYFIPKKYDAMYERLRIKEKIWKLKGALSKKVVAHYTKPDGTFIMPPFPNSDVYSTLAGSDCIKNLVLHISVYNKPDAHNLILSLPALTELTIQNRFADSKFKKSCENTYPHLIINVVSD
jgi:hypothetical protein